MFNHNYRYGNGWTIEAPVFWYSYIGGVCVWRIPAGVLCVLYSRLEMVTASIGDPNGLHYLLLVVCYENSNVSKTGRYCLSVVVFLSIHGVKYQ